MKKTKTKWVAILAAMAMTISLAGCSKDESDDSDSAQYLYGQITAIDGNDVTINVATKSDNSGDDSANAQDNNNGNQQGDNQNGDGQQGGEPGGDMSGMDFPGDGNGQQGGPQQGGNNSTNGYTFTGDELTIRIPVGVDVKTSLGADTTFSTLAVGDMIKYTVGSGDDSDTVTAVWILDLSSDNNQNNDKKNDDNDQNNNKNQDNTDSQGDKDTNA